MLDYILLSPTDLANYGKEQIDGGNKIWGIIVLIVAVLGVCYFIYNFFKKDKSD